METLGVILTVCLASFFCIWLANQLVGLLSGEHPRDTERLWIRCSGCKDYHPDPGHDASS